MTRSTIITPADIATACGYIVGHRNEYRLQRPLPTTPAHRRAAILAAGREAIANVLIDRLKMVPNWKALTKGIRAGHNGAATDFDTINEAGAVALGIWEQ